MNRVVVIGVGSPMDNDHIAWDVIDILAENEVLHPCIPSELTLIKSDRPGSRLLEYMQGAEHVILIDTLQGEHASSYRCLSPEQLQEEDILLSSHGFGVAEALQLAQALSKLPPDLSIYGIAIGAEPLLIGKVIFEAIQKSLY